VGAKDAYCRAQTEEGRESVVSDWLRHYSKDFHAEGIRKLVHRWEKCVTLIGDYGEKKLRVYLNCKS